MTPQFPKKYRRDNEYEDLYNNFEHLFCDVFWGFDVGPGWFNYVAEFVVKLDVYTKKNKLDPQKYKIMTVKNKFGFLRIYLASSDFYLNSLLGEIESMASESCIVCGKKTDGIMGLYSQMCEEHIKEF
mgnify:CR=1 FL=1|tara:strand:- start:818 stop:1201 length:384 start_codon:yes stop_codon:yes gene_type:complete